MYNLRHMFAIYKDDRYYSCHIKLLLLICIERAILDQLVVNLRNV